MFLKYIGKEQSGTYALEPNKFYHVKLKITTDILAGTDDPGGIKYVLERKAEDDTIVSYVHFSLEELNQNWEAYEGFTLTTPIHKLVRDKIPEKIIHNEEFREIPFFHKLTDKDEILNALEDKLYEEFKEYKESKDVEELADMVEVIYAILNTLGVSRDLLSEKRRRKRSINGGFEKAIVLDYTVADDEKTLEPIPVYYFMNDKEVVE